VTPTRSAGLRARNERAGRYMAACAIYLGRTDTLQIMIMWIPGGADGLFQEMREYLQTVDGAPDPEMVAEIQARYRCTQVGSKIPISRL
jgi:hypothetical protein